MTVKEATDTPILDLLGEITVDSVEASGLDPKTLMMVRFAALIAVDAPPASYMMNLAVAGDLGLNEQQARDVILAVAPIVGTPRTISALSKIARAVGLAIELDELDKQANS